MAEEKPIVLSPQRNAAVFLDTKSLSIAGDGSFRYTLVAKSLAGATSINYGRDALRNLRNACLHLAGRKDGSWTEARNKEWFKYQQFRQQSPTKYIGVGLRCSYRRICRIGRQRRASYP